jgi:glutathione S-transferase
MVDAKRDTEAAEQLLAGGGRLKVPCLRIKQQGEVRWLYESDDIIAFIEAKLS